MNTTKTLMLAALAALSLGVGTAMADGDGGLPDYQAQHQRAIAAAQAPVAHSAVQSGASDVEPVDSGFGAWFKTNHNLLDMGNVGG